MESIGINNKSVTEVKMDKPYLLWVIYSNSKGVVKYRGTNDSDTADRLSIRYNGEVYIDNRYKAKLRLYNYINRIR